MAVLRTAVLALAATHVAADATYTAIGGYTPGSDVVAHSQIDLDMQALEVSNGAYNWTDVYTMYNEGGNSAKSSGLRTLRGFSVDASKMIGEDTFDLYNAYWGTVTYGDDLIMAAINGTVYSGMNSDSFDFGANSDTMRKEIIQKGISYQIVWQYVLHEIYDAINDCNDDSITDNDNGVHAWDEGWAFYAGSLTGTAGYPDSGTLVYELANKRCQNFETCDGYSTSGNSLVNQALLTHFENGRDFLTAGSCSDAEALIAPIVAQMAVPLIQGTLRYAYKADLNGGAEGDKAIAEGWAFAMAALPLINSVDSTAADTVYNNMWIGLDEPVPDGYDAVATAIQGVYSGLGVSCTDVGGLVQDATAGTYYIAACTDSPTMSPTAAGGAISAAAHTASGIALVSATLVASIGAFLM